MATLRSRLKNKKSLAKTTTGTKGSRKKQAAPILIDLDNEEDDDDADEDEENSGLPEREQKQLEILERELAKCQRCGPDKYCKIDKSGSHVPLTMNQRRAWSIFLV